VHGLLAADLALDTATSPHGIWNAVCPTPGDLASMPLVWPATLQALLPGPARKLLSKQRWKFDRDWAAVSASLVTVAEEGQLTEERYRYGWLLANTRTFYYLSPTLRRRAKADRMVLQPVADLFNHADVGCVVNFDAESFVVCADRAYKRGEEVRICYGRHGGDFLAVEYGFVMRDNQWDEVGLDEVVLPRLGGKWRERLEEKGFLGEYVLDKGAVCHRTQVAIRTMCCGVREWGRFVDGEDDGAGSQEKVDKLLVEMLEVYRTVIEERINVVRGMEDQGEESQRELLIQRWKHIDQLVETTINRLQGE
jgi:hypothetical protein